MCCQQSGLERSWEKNSRIRGFGCGLLKSMKRWRKWPVAKRKSWNLGRLSTWYTGSHSSLKCIQNKISCKILRLRILYVGFTCSKSQGSLSRKHFTNNWTRVQVKIMKTQRKMISSFREHKMIFPFREYKIIFSFRCGSSTHGRSREIEWATNFEQDNALCSSGCFSSSEPFSVPGTQD